MSEQPAASVLCPACEASAPSGVTCPSCGGALLLNQRYSLERLLGSGGQSRVYLARDGHDGRTVAIKRMSLERVHQWKSVELFRRAAAVLAGLDHPGVPKLVEYFEEQRPGLAFYCLVHEFVDGRTLAQALHEGERFSEKKVVGIACEALGILAYLHGLSPPVIHRDVKPSNLMRRSDGRLVLIDFDLVRDVLRPEGGSTMSIGTPGYAPLEQLVGDATPATDLYALGMTLVVLLSRKEPLAMRNPGEQRIEFRKHVNVSKPLARVLERLLEPDVARRYQSAEAVLADLADLANIDRPAPASGEEHVPSPAGFELLESEPDQPTPRRPTPSETQREAASDDTEALVASGTRKSRLPLIVGGVVLVAAVSLIALLQAEDRGSPRVTSPPPVPTAAVETEAATEPPPTKRKRHARPEEETPPEMANQPAPAEVERVLTAGPWAGNTGEESVMLTVTRKGTKLEGRFTEQNRFTGAYSGEERKVAVEIRELGTVILRSERVNDGVTIREAFSGDLTSDFNALLGTCERIYEQSGSRYAAGNRWRFNRIEKVADVESAVADPTGAEAALIGHKWVGRVAGRPAILRVTRTRSRLVGQLEYGMNDLGLRVEMGKDGSVRLLAQKRPTPRGLASVTLTGNLAPDFHAMSGDFTELVQQGMMSSKSSGEWQLESR